MKYYKYRPYPSIITKATKISKVVALLPHKITNLKNFIEAYGNRKSDVEISQMLDISIDQVKKQRKEVLGSNRKKKTKEE